MPKDPLAIAVSGPRRWSAAPTILILSALAAGCGTPPGTSSAPASGSKTASQSEAQDPTIGSTSRSTSPSSEDIDALFNPSVTERATATPENWFHDGRTPGLDAQLLKLLESVREAHPVPGLTLAVLDGSTLRALAATGIRKKGHAAPVTDQDRWHLGSDTKAMTATLAAGLVAEGALAWKTTLVEAFPHYAETMHESLRSVTLHDLLCHRGGFDAIPMSDGIWAELFDFEGTDREAREAMLEVVLQEPPKVQPGTYFYSNTGYMVAGAMLEARTDRSWQQLLRERLFAPLGMTRVGFGPPGAHDDALTDSALPTAPWGHAAPFGKLNGVDPTSIRADNPSSLGPAGTVHASMTDWCRFLRAHLAGARRETQPLQLGARGFKFLHAPWAGTPNDDSYASGFGVVRDEKLGRGPILQHAGSNTMWFAVFVIVPQENFAIAVATNIATADAQAACQLATEKAADWLRTLRSTR